MNQFAGYAHPIRGGWWLQSVPAVGDQLNSGPGFIRGKSPLVDGSASLPRMSPFGAPLVALMSKPINGLFGRRKGYPDTAVIDHNGCLPACHQHIQRPHERSLIPSTNPRGGVIVPGDVISAGDRI
jgi:hypothetical protein